MTTINTSSLNPYVSSLNLTVKKEADAATSTAVVEEKKTVAVSLPVAQTKEASGAGGAKSSTDETIEKLQQQIRETQKQLTELREQLAAAQAGTGTPEEKAQRVMALQMQIATASAALQNQQGALLQLITSGGVNTTA
jgi:predicted RNase H-like nuclease (RuvC/YqgF family)